MRNQTLLIGETCLCIVDRWKMRFQSELATENWAVTILTCGCESSCNTKACRNRHHAATVQRYKFVHDARMGQARLVGLSWKMLGSANLCCLRRSSCSPDLYTAIFAKCAPASHTAESWIETETTWTQPSVSETLRTATDTLHSQRVATLAIRPHPSRFGHSGTLMSTSLLSSHLRVLFVARKH